MTPRDLLVGPIPGHDYGSHPGATNITMAACTFAINMEGTAFSSEANIVIHAGPILTILAQSCTNLSIGMFIA